MATSDCFFFLKGKCTKGSLCTFRHCEACLSNPTPCKYWIKGECTNLSCSFRHPSRVASPQAFPAGPTACIFFARGACNKGTDCPFSHSPQITPSPTPTPPSPTQHAQPDAPPPQPTPSFGLPPPQVQPRPTAQDFFGAINDPTPAFTPASPASPASVFAPKETPPIRFGTSSTFHTVTSAPTLLASAAPQDARQIIAQKRAISTHGIRPQQPVTVASQLPPQPTACASSDGSERMAKRIRLAGRKGPAPATSAPQATQATPVPICSAKATAQTEKPQPSIPVIRSFEEIIAEKRAKERVEREVEQGGSTSQATSPTRKTPSASALVTTAAHTSASMSNGASMATASAGRGGARGRGRGVGVKARGGIAAKPSNTSATPPIVNADTSSLPSTKATTTATLASGKATPPPKVVAKPNLPITTETTGVAPQPTVSVASVANPPPHRPPIAIRRVSDSTMDSQAMGRNSAAAGGVKAKSPATKSLATKSPATATQPVAAAPPAPRAANPPCPIPAITTTTTSPARKALYEDDEDDRELDMLLGL